MRLQAAVAYSSFALVLSGVLPGAWVLVGCSDSVAARDGGAAGPPVDASSAEIGPPAADDASADAPIDAGSLSCQPGSIAGFVPHHYIGPLTRSTACAGFDGEGGLVQTYGDSCLGASATYKACRGFSAPDAAGAGACLRCLGSSAAPGAPGYAVVLEGTGPVLNYPGCIQAVDPTDAGVSCALAMEAALECFDYACKTACPPVVDDVSLNAYLACVNTAQTSVCLGYALSVRSCVEEEASDGGSPVATICFGGGVTGSAEDHYLTTAPYFCGK
jgi:hypothetical protein